MAVTCRGLLTIPIGKKEKGLILVTDLPAYVKGNLTCIGRQEVLRIEELADTLELN